MEDLPPDLPGASRGGVRSLLDGGRRGPGGEPGVTWTDPALEEGWHGRSRAGPEMRSAHMAERRNIGEILLDLGRITQEDVQEAVRHQQQNGGYFGEALVALGKVTREELEYCLASQHDLPYVFPEAESIDREAAGLVSAEWALAHLVLPILRTDRTLTVLVDSPLWNHALDELEARTELDVQLALAPRQRIRELIPEVFGGTAGGPGGIHPAVSVDSFLAEAIGWAAPRFGISSRATRAWGWLEVRGAIHRRELEASWEIELARALLPPVHEQVGVGGEKGSWHALVGGRGATSSVHVTYLSSPGAVEILFRPRHDASRAPSRLGPPPAEILTEIRLLARTGAARVAVTSEPPGLSTSALPHLPALLLDPSWRSVHLGEADDEMPATVFTYQFSGRDASTRSEALEELRGFAFDVLTVDLSTSDTEWLIDLLPVAPATFVRQSASADPGALREAGLRWRLHLEEEGEERLVWSLQPLESLGTPG